MGQVWSFWSVCDQSWMRLGSALYLVVDFLSVLDRLESVSEPFLDFDFGQISFQITV